MSCNLLKSTVKDVEVCRYRHLNAQFGFSRKKIALRAVIRIPEIVDTHESGETRKCGGDA